MLVEGSSHHTISVMECCGACLRQNQASGQDACNGEQSLSKLSFEMHSSCSDNTCKVIIVDLVVQVLFEACSCGAG